MLTEVTEVTEVKLRISGSNEKDSLLISSFLFSC